MFRLLTIVSGSKANVTVVELNGRRILIDCGLAYRSLNSAVACESIDAVFITHSHSDHTKGLPVLKKNITAPFYSGVDIDGCERISRPINIAGMTVAPFACSHDVPCVGYKIEAEGKSVAIATDTGVVTDSMLEYFLGCDTVMLECNHDPQMLKYGPYPQMLKARIASPEGHLSNGDCAKVLTYLASQGTKKAVLAHLSETNNTPLTARKEVLETLTKYGLADKMEIYVAGDRQVIEI